MQTLELGIWLLGLFKSNSWEQSSKIQRQWVLYIKAITPRPRKGESHTSTYENKEGRKKKCFSWFLDLPNPLLDLLRKSVLALAEDLWGLGREEERTMQLCWPGGSCSHPGKIQSPRTCCPPGSTAPSFVAALSQSCLRLRHRLLLSRQHLASCLLSLRTRQSRAVLDTHTHTGLLTSLFMMTLPWGWSFPKVSFVCYLVWILTLFGSPVFIPFLCLSRIHLPKVT